MWTSFFASIFLFFLFPVFAYADVIISEIMYDVPGSDSGREWIEIQNTGTETVDITGWKLFEDEVNHKIVAETSARIPAGGYAIIADNPTTFRTDHPSFSGLIFDSAFSLKNTGESLALKNASSTLLFEAIYETRYGKGDGNSLNRIGSGFEARIPSPGATLNTSAFTPKVSETKGNSVESAGVQESDSADISRAVSNTASASSFGGESSGMIPWVLALFGVIALGSAALLFQGTSRGSGYSIIEEKQ